MSFSAIYSAAPYVQHNNLASSIKLCGGHEFCACHDSVEKCPRFNAYGTLFAERRVRLVSIIVKIVA
jgi:hypothetical protein